jgi:two-component sensor histidine kinase
MRGREDHHAAGKRAGKDVGAEQEQAMLLLEAAQEELAELAEENRRLAAENARLHGDNRRQRQTILQQAQQLTAVERDSAAQSSKRGSAAAEAERKLGLLDEELRVSLQELQATNDELARANEALRLANRSLEQRVAERTETLERSTGELAAALAERDRLLERQKLIAVEIDRRVKHNLQLVTSVLTMQASSLPHADAQRALMQAANRVQAIAHAHRLMQGAASGDRLAFHDYIGSLCSDLRNLLGPDGKGRRLALESERAEIGSAAAIPMALIVNELVTNAFRHAFPDGRSGTVRVGFHRHEPDQWRLTVSDDGVGLKRWVTRGRASGLGARIVNAMVRQLNGRLEVSAGEGAEFTILLPRDESGKA